MKRTKPKLRFTKNRLQRSVGCAVTGKWLHRWFSAQPNLLLQKIIIGEHDCECNLTDFCAFTISFARLIDQLFRGILVDSQKTRLRTTDARTRSERALDRFFKAIFLENEGSREKISFYIFDVFCHEESASFTAMMSWITRIPRIMLVFSACHVHCSIRPIRSSTNWSTVEISF